MREEGRRAIRIMLQLHLSKSRQYRRRVRTYIQNIPASKQKKEASQK